MKKARVIKLAIVPSLLRPNLANGYFVNLDMSNLVGGLDDLSTPRNIFLIICIDK